MTPQTKTVLFAALGLGVAGGLFYWWKSSQNASRSGAGGDKGAGGTLPSGGAQTAQNVFSGRGPSDLPQGSAPSSFIPQQPAADGSDLFSAASNLQTPQAPASSFGAASRMLAPSWARSQMAQAPIAQSGGGAISGRVNIGARAPVRAPPKGSGASAGAFVAGAQSAYDSISRLIEMSYQSPCSNLPSSSPAQPKQLGPFAGLNDELQAAISHYQAAHNLPVTGQPDDATMANLTDYENALRRMCSGNYPQSFRVIV